MIIRLQRQLDQFANVGLQLILLAVGAKLDSRTGWLVCTALIVLVSLYAWVSSLRRRRAIVDTPTSRIASAAQGYVELRGVGKPLPGEPLLSRLRGLPCLWYEFIVEERTGSDKWRSIDSGTSDASFILDDGTGQCVIDVDGAEILTRHKEQWRAGSYRNTEWTLQIGDPTYALGEFRTIGGGNVDLDVRRDVDALLTEWKKDQPALLKRFDLNQDRTIDLEEWALARQAARREVARQHNEARAEPEVNTMRRPASGQHYLLSNFDPDQLARRYLWWSIFHLIAFFGALAALPMIWRHHF
jgi:hypothetical protein